MNGTESMNQAVTQGPGGGTILTMLLAPMLLLAIVSVLVFVLVYKHHRNNVLAGISRPYNVLFKILCLLGGVINFVIVGFIVDWSFRFGEAIILVLLLLLPGILSQYLYFLPYMIANAKGHHQETAIFILNLFTGWTVLAWIIALVWSCTTPKGAAEVSVRVPKELKKYKELLDAEVITREEFEEKKKKLLNI